VRRARGKSGRGKKEEGDRLGQNEKLMPAVMLEYVRPTRGGYGAFVDRGGECRGKSEGKIGKHTAIKGEGIG